MIYYFSGTGNSLSIAKYIAQYTNDILYDMSSHKVGIDNLGADTSVGFIFPIYAWGLPKVVADFFSAISPAPQQVRYTYTIFTCGDDIGYADKILIKTLHSKGWKIDCIFSIIMRETYICLPGFDIDSQEVESRKYAAAIAKAKEIAERINFEKNSCNASINNDSSKIKANCKSK